MRQADDFYETPAWCVHAILPHLSKADCFIDLGCGTGAIMRAIAKYDDTAEIYGVEQNKERAKVARGLVFTDDASEVFTDDALTRDFEHCEGATVVMNPPYGKGLALAFVKRALEIVGTKGEVAALLRLNWLEGKARKAFHKEHPSDVYVLSRRPSFTGGGTDACAYAWFVWGQGRGGEWAIL